MAVRTALARGACALLLLAGLPAHALDILLTNDDGFETALLRGLQSRLKAAGHDVIVSAPAQNNSGTGGWIVFFKPIGPLAKDSRHGSVKAGAPGVGTDPDDPGVHYVDGTPVMSLLYGLDVLAPKRWGKAPDLIISGPNEGNNLGAIVVSSGTVANALYGINRGIPSLAVSYAELGSRSWKALADGAVEYEVGEIVVKLVAALKGSVRAEDALLEHGVGLNVNIPKFAPGQGTALPLRLTRMTPASNFVPVFFEKLSDSPLAVRFKAGADAPGISFATPEIPPPAGAGIPQDDAADGEGNAIRENVVTISVISGVPAAPSDRVTSLRVRLGSMVQSAE